MFLLNFVSHGHRRRTSLDDLPICESGYIMVYPVEHEAGVEALGQQGGHVLSLEESEMKEICEFSYVSYRYVDCTL